MLRWNRWLLKHRNYARWLPVHLTQIIILKEIHPSLCEKFNDGKFIVQIANRKFSKTVLDQNHARLHGGIKGAGRAIALTENVAALQSWLINWPEAARLLKQIFYTVHEKVVLKKHNFCASVVKLFQTLRYWSDVKVQWMIFAIHFQMHAWISNLLIQW